MLETENGLRVKALFLGQVHPSLPKARLVRVPCMEDEINLIVADQLARGEAVSEALPGVDAPFTLLGQTKLTTVFVCARISQCARLLVRTCLRVSRRFSVVLLCARGSRDEGF